MEGMNPSAKIEQKIEPRGSHGANGIEESVNHHNTDQWVVFESSELILKFPLDKGGWAD